MERIYDYITLDHIQKYLSPNFLRPITFDIEFLPLQKSEDHYICEDEYLHTTLMNNRPENGDGPRFQYRINKNGFRSDHFDVLKNENLNILVAGCSYTFGEGLPEEYVWGKLLQNQIQEQVDKNVKMYNLGYMGNSHINIISLIKSFINQYGKPDYLFVVFPDLTRDVLYDQSENRYKNVMVQKRYIENKNQFKNEFEYVRSFVYENNIYKGINLMHLLEMICDLAGIRLIWTGWNIPDLELYRRSSFKYFIEIPSELLPIIDEHSENAKEVIRLADLENVDNWPYWKKARDMNHPGSRWTKNISKMFFNEIENKYGTII